jgi:hypothetical protein
MGCADTCMGYGPQKMRNGAAEVLEDLPAVSGWAQLAA